MELCRESNRKSVSAGSCLKRIPIVVVLAGSLLVCALWDGRHVTDPTARVDNGDEAFDRQVEYALQSVRAIRVGSDSPPWVMMHALLAFGPDFAIVDVKRNRPVGVLDWICGPGSSAFFQVAQGGSLTELRRPVALWGHSECHADQWLYVLSTHPVPLLRTILLPEGSFTLRDLLETGKRRCASECTETSAWTVPAFCRYVPRKARWQNERGEKVTMTGLATDFLQREDWRTGPCRGTHHLYALASLQAAGILKGDAAARLDQTLKEALRLLQRNQNSDGTWMCNWQTERDKPQNVFDTIHITGHHLEWIALAATQVQLNEKWLRDAVHGLVTAVEGVNEVEVRKMMATRPEIYGSLCHAVRALHLIHRRWCCAPDRGTRR